MKKILDIIGSLKFAFYLLVSAAAVMWIGSLYASNNYEIINSMNGVNVYKWFSKTGSANIGITWWLLPMFAIFFLLGVNTFACTLKRILNLLPKRNSVSFKKFFIMLSPSLIHLLFMIMLTGHLAGFLFIEYEKVSIAEGTETSLKDAGSITVMSVKHEFYPDDSLMKDRIRQTYAAVKFNDGSNDKPVVISYLKPVFRNGAVIQLDMRKKKKSEAALPVNAAGETCNKEKHFHYSEAMNREQPELFLAATRDPGLFLLIPGFFVVIILMGWYFYQITIRKEQVNGPENGDQ